VERIRIEVGAAANLQRICAEPIAMNECVFSPDRKYRYLLIHRWEPAMPERSVMWIGLNPSIADEHQLDNTLTRIRSFSRTLGFNTFHMTNLFALVSTNLSAMIRHPEPIGEDNDVYIRQIATQLSTIFVAWGAHGSHRNRDRHVLDLLTKAGRTDLLCFGINKEGSPKHPLHLAGNLKPVAYRL
jgi:hypothetical protein